MSSLLVAIGFSILLNLALVSSFIWPWSLGETFPFVAWPMIFLIWGTSSWIAYNGLTDVMSVPTSEKVAVPERPDTLFIQAQREYLGGHWEEAESLLMRQIENVPRDMEARLLLATLFRHTRRLNMARDQISAIQRFDEAFEWEFEIDRELQLIDLIEAHEAGDEAEPMSHFENETQSAGSANRDDHVQLDVKPSGQQTMASTREHQE
jgi:hypothetical protein